MKHFIAHLPSRSHYELVESNRPDQFWFLDKFSPAFRIRSPVVNPFGDEWCILAGCVNVRDLEHNQRINYKIDFKLFPVSEINDHSPRGKLIRDTIKGNAFLSPAPISFVFPRRHPKDKENKLIPVTLVYQFIPHNREDLWELIHP